MRLFKNKPLLVPIKNVLAKVFHFDAWSRAEPSTKSSFGHFYIYFLLTSHSKISPTAMSVISYSHSI